MANNKRSICNAFVFDSDSGQCTIGAYEKDKGFTKRSSGGSFYMDMGDVKIAVKQ